ncbi:type II toxin-antitoxin system VapC family toxin [Rarobacter incanus]|uniref:Putative nucleic acid-binding protein n=1 Tax=Rarobacter incanus TaxID=153494 RepID=A0A542SP78_9MICO|nr:type II toxin-antitoxin system VapC family toxin [Rarobacter incanus]TQK76426.1 putative nucleic acid-binding protein [Rarobacter incanus]
MAVVYFDAAALVSLCVHSPRTALARRLWVRADALITAHVARVQVPAALAQARRAALLGEADMVAALRQWEAALAQMCVMEASPGAAERAARLAVECDIRADDAWHLAAAERFNSSDMIFAVWDSRLEAAARGRGLPVCG